MIRVSALAEASIGACFELPFHVPDTPIDCVLLPSPTEGKRVNLSASWDCIQLCKRVYGGIDMVWRILSAGMVTTLVLSGSAMAQSLEAVKGSVLIDRGEGFTAAYEGPVKAGNRIRVATGGSAAVNYGGGVVIPVRPGQVYAVSQVYGQGAGDGSNQNRTAKRVGAAFVAAALTVIILCGPAEVCDDDDDNRRRFVSP